jgi:amidase
LGATIYDIHEAILSKRTTCEEVVRQHLARVEAYNAQGPTLNAVKAVNPRALDEARAFDAAFKSSGKLRTLDCVTVLVKDTLDTKDLPTTYGSAAFSGFVPERDSTVVAKLRAAGAIVIAKATLGEFGSGYIDSSGPVKNPYDLERHPSGSSSGTAAGVAADFAVIGIGADTGGSIRGPAAANSLVGLKPTISLVSRFGNLPSTPSRDTIGPIGQTVRDVAILLGVMTGYDDKDPKTRLAVGRPPLSLESTLVASGLRGARIGFIQQPTDRTTDPNSAEYKAIREVILRALDDMRTLGAQIVDGVVLPNVIPRLDDAYDGNVFETEAAINAFLAQHANSPFPTLAEALASGKFLPSREPVLRKFLGRSTAEAGYVRVQSLMAETRRQLLEVMDERRLDALVYASADHRTELIALDAMTNPNAGKTRKGTNRRLASVADLPAITTPAGFDAYGFPVGVEFMGRPFSDETLLRLAYAYEQMTHHRKAPATTPPLR